MLSRTTLVIIVMPKYTLRQMGLIYTHPSQASIVSKRHRTSGNGSKQKVTECKIIVETITDTYSYLVHLIKNLHRRDSFPVSLIVTSAGRVLTVETHVEFECILLPGYTSCVCKFIQVPK